MFEVSSQVLFRFFQVFYIKISQSFYINQNVEILIVLDSHLNLVAVNKTSVARESLWNKLFATARYVV